jgi:hypothetical protein
MRVCLLRVNPANAELWDGPSSKVVAAFEFVKAQFIGENNGKDLNRAIQFAELLFALAIYPTTAMEAIMGRGILLWLIGVPIPVIILLALVFHH